MTPVLFMLCADLVLRNGKIVTLDPAQPQVEAIAITSGKIVALGSNAQITRQITSSTKVIDLNGHLAIPGFIEGHGHFMGLGESKMMLNLRDAKKLGPNRRHWSPPQRKKPSRATGLSDEDGIRRSGTRDRSRT